MLTKTMIKYHIISNYITFFFSPDITIRLSENVTPGTPIFSKERHLLLIKCKVNIINFIHKVQVGHRFSPRLCNRSPFYSLTSLGLKICLTIIIFYLLLFLKDCQFYSKY